VDSDFAGEAGTPKSTSGYVFLLGMGVIEQHSKCHALTATATVDTSRAFIVDQQFKSSFGFESC